MRKHPDVAGSPDKLRLSLMARLGRIEGQVRGVARMVELGRPPAEILQQLASVQAAVRGAARLLLHDHLVKTADEIARSGDDAYDELLEDLIAFMR